MKKILKKSFITLTLLGLLSTASAEQASSESVKQLMQQVGAGQLGVQVMQQMIPSLKAMVPNAPESFWQEMKQEAKPEDLVNLITPIYQKYLSQADVDAITAFYQTPAGQNLIKAQPKITQESMIAGQQWGQQLAKKILERYQQQYPQ